MVGGRGKQRWEYDSNSVVGTRGRGRASRRWSTAPPTGSWILGFRCSASICGRGLHAGPISPDTQRATTSFTALQVATVPLVLHHGHAIPPETLASRLPWPPIRPITIPETIHGEHSAHCHSCPHRWPAGCSGPPAPPPAPPAPLPRPGPPRAPPRASARTRSAAAAAAAPGGR